nr:response regulator [Marivibrio halodurans]
MICVVDDDAMLRDALDALLSEAGHEVRCVADGLEALDVLEVWPADLILCDLLMPGAEGFELLRTVRRKRLGMWFIMMSGAQGELAHFLNHAPVLGADATIRKPFKPNALFETIETVSRTDRPSGIGHSDEEHDDGQQ